MYVRVPLKKKDITRIFKKCKPNGNHIETMGEIISKIYYKAFNVEDFEKFNNTHQPRANNLTWNFIVSKIRILARKADYNEEFESKMVSQWVRHGFGIIESHRPELDDFQIEYLKEF